MKKTIAGVSILAVLALAGTSAVIAAEKYADARHGAGLKRLGLKVYWGLLTDGQKEQAKEILADHLARTQPDREAALARLLRYRSDVAAVLTVEQRREGMRLREAFRGQSKERRVETVRKLLDRTDRAALADRVERIVDAMPEDQVTIGLEVLDQFHALLLGEAETRLGLSADQTGRIGRLYAEFRADIREVAVRLAAEKAATVRRALGILDEAQRAKVEQTKEEILDKVLSFLRD